MTRLCLRLSCGESSSRCGEWSRHPVQMSFYLTRWPTFLPDYCFAPRIVGCLSRPACLRGTSFHDPVGEIKSQSHAIASACFIEGRRPAPHCGGVGTCDNVIPLILQARCRGLSNCVYLGISNRSCRFSHGQGVLERESSIFRHHLG